MNTLMQLYYMIIQLRTKLQQVQTTDEPTQTEIQELMAENLTICYVSSIPVRC